MKQYLSIIFFLLTLSVWSQDKPDRLKPIGNIPEKMLMTFEDMLGDQVISSNIYRPRAERLSEIHFYESSNFWVNELLSSGDLLYGDEVSNYVNQVCDELLKNHPEIHESISVFVINSNAMNAFATDQGIIVVNTGLLARLENEAQLAMVLAHEITHYLEKHNVSGHLEEYKLENDPTNRDKSSYEKVLSKHSYSRDMETEADHKGLDIFLESDYTVGQTLDLFDLLEEASAPVFTDKPSLSLRDGEISISLDIPDSLKISLAEVKNDSLEYDEEMSTHPDPIKRKSSLDSLIQAKNIDLTKGSKFIVGLDAFNKAKYRCILEMPRLYLLDGELDQAIYHSLVLKQRGEYPEYYDLIIAKAILKHAMYLEYTGSTVSFNPDYVDNDTHWAILQYFEETDPEQAKSDVLQFIETLDNELNNAETMALMAFANSHITLGEHEEKSANNGNADNGKYVAALSPKIIMIDFRKEHKERYIEESEIEDAMLENLNENERVKTFSIKSLNSNEQEEFYETNILNTYFREALNSYPTFPTDFEEVENIKNKHDLNAVVLPFGIRVKKLRKFGAQQFFLASLVYPITPLLVAQTYIPIRRNFFAIQEVNLNTYSIQDPILFSPKGKSDKGLTRYMNKQIRKGFY